MLLSFSDFPFRSRRGSVGGGEGVMEMKMLGRVRAVV